MDQEGARVLDCSCVKHFRVHQDFFGLQEIVGGGLESAGGGAASS